MYWTRAAYILGGVCLRSQGKISAHNVKLVRNIKYCGIQARSSKTIRNGTEHNDTNSSAIDYEVI